MNNTIKLLRGLLNDFNNGRANRFELADAFKSDVPILLDKLEKLEVVAEAAHEACRSIPGMLPKIEKALAALEGEK